MFLPFEARQVAMGRANTGTEPANSPASSAGSELDALKQQWPICKRSSRIWRRSKRCLRFRVTQGRRLAEAFLCVAAALPHSAQAVVRHRPLRRHSGARRKPRNPEPIWVTTFFWVPDWRFRAHPE